MQNTTIKLVVKHVSKFKGTQRNIIYFFFIKKDIEVEEWYSKNPQNLQCLYRIK